MLKNFEALVDNESAVKLIFDNVKNVAVTGVVAAFAEDRFTHLGQGWHWYRNTLAGTLFAGTAIFLFLLAIMHFRFRLRDLMGWKSSLLWLALDGLYLILAWEAARMLIFAKLHS